MLVGIINSIRRLFVWSCAVLAIGVAVLAARSFWRCDEAGYYSYKPAPPPSQGRDSRNLIGSCRGGLFWLRMEADVQRLDWYSGEPTEIIRNSAPGPQLASAALATVGGSDFEPLPRWSRGGFNLKAERGQSPGNHWWYQGIVVPHWALFLLLAWVPALRLRRRWIVRQRRRHGLCPNCGYDVRASGEVCSECGSSLRKIEPAASTPRPARRVRWVAVGALVAGLAILGFYLHQRSESSSPFVRLGPATTLPADNLPRQIELDLGGGVSMRFVLIPSGRFLMGSPPSEAGRQEDERQHEVLISKPFYMGITEVTQEQYEAVMGVKPSSFKGAKNPVETESWIDATFFCHQLSVRSGRKVRLPTEAEWEYACRAGTSTPFHTGQALARNTANYFTEYSFPSNRTGKSERRTLPVGSFKPNAWGLYDMHGNVWEWCQVWYGDYPAGDVTDPTGPDSGTSRVLRGGGWCGDPVNCRAACRNGFSPVVPDLPFGFRVCLDLAKDVCPTSIQNRRTHGCGERDSTPSPGADPVPPRDSAAKFAP